MSSKSPVMYRGTGKRKNSVARVILSPGSGEAVVNGKPLATYFPRQILQAIATAPLRVSGTEGTVATSVPGSTAAASPARPAPCATASPGR